MCPPYFSFFSPFVFLPPPPSCFSVCTYTLTWCVNIYTYLNLHLLLLLPIVAAGDARVAAGPYFPLLLPFPLPHLISFLKWLFTSVYFFVFFFFILCWFYTWVSLACGHVCRFLLPLALEAGEISPMPFCFLSLFSFSRFICFNCVTTVTTSCGWKKTNVPSGSSTKIVAECFTHIPRQPVLGTLYYDGSFSSPLFFFLRFIFVKLKLNCLLHQHGSMCTEATKFTVQCSFFFYSSHLWFVLSFLCWSVREGVGETICVHIYLVRMWANAGCMWA